MTRLWHSVPLSQVFSPWAFLFGVCVDNSLVCTQIYSDGQQRVRVLWHLATGLPITLAGPMASVQMEVRCCPPSLPTSTSSVSHKWGDSDTCAHSGPEAQAPLPQEVCLWLYGFRVHRSEMRCTDKRSGPFRPQKQAQVMGSAASRVPGTQAWSRRKNGGSSWVYPLGLKNRWE